MIQGQQNVPALRFSEFSGEWLPKTLLELSQSGFSNGVFNDPSKVGAGYKLINVKDMYKGNEVSLAGLSLLELPQKEFEKNKVVWGDVFFTRSSLVKEGIAYSCVFLSDDENTTYDGHLIKMSPDREQVNPKYLGYALKVDSLRKQLVARGKTTTMTTIGQEDVSSVVMVLGETTEQQKIASFLSSVDRKIEQLGKKKALLEQYKKGMMQKLFSQELRFKDDQGNDFPDWEEKRLGEVASNVGGTALEKFMAPNGTHKVISIGNYGKGGSYSDNGNRVLLNTKTETKLLNKGDLVMVLNDKTSSGDIIGSTILIDSDDSYIYNQRSERIICNNTVLPTFMWQLLNSKNFRLKVFKLSQGGTQIYVNFPIVKSIKINVPSILEQQKIATFLSSIDQKIDLVATELNHAKIFKKGLLQQMFI